jgi:hypothetical protein
MGRFHHILIIPVALVATAVLVAPEGLTPQSIEPTLVEMKQNRVRLERWQADPKNQLWLCDELRALLNEPEERLLALRKVDRALSQEKPSAQARHFEVMERYANWLDHLPPAARDEIRQANGPRARLEVLRRIRTEQWIEHLPRADRDRLARSQGAQREQLLKELRQRDRQRRREWAAALQRWDGWMNQRPPARRAVDAKEVQTFIREYLRVRLSEEEKEHLAAAMNRKGQVAPRVLVELADRYPLALPGPRGPVHFQELPADLRGKLQMLEQMMKQPIDRLQRPRWAALRDRARRAEGHWPQFGSVLAAFIRNNNIRLDVELFPTRPGDLSETVRLFLDFDLKPVLTPAEKEELGKAEKRWPAFPLTIQKLAQNHKLRVPWQTLPGPRQWWDTFRPPSQIIAAYHLPPLSRHHLRTFARLELTADQRSQFGLSPPELPDWQRLRLEYFRHKPEELKRMRQAEK